MSEKIVTDFACFEGYLDLGMLQVEFEKLERRNGFQSYISYMRILNYGTVIDLT